jgi:hypothetical protein
MQNDRHPVFKNHIASVLNKIKLLYKLFILLFNEVSNGNWKSTFRLLLFLGQKNPTVVALVLIGE